MKKLILEIHRRSLWQVLGIYLAGGWVAFQVVKELTDTALLPAWVPPFAMALLVLGFPIVMATAFIQEGGPGEVGERVAPPASSRRRAWHAAADRRGAVGAAADRRRTSCGPANRCASRERPDGAVRRLFTWRNALLGGVAAFALLGFVMAGWMVMRALGIGPAATLVAKGVLDERATVVLADFAPAGPLARATTEALRIDLSQSRVVRLAEPSRVRAALERMARDPAALERMARDPAAPLDRETALELAVREGLPAVITGEIHVAGSGYVFSAALVDAADRDVLASHRVTAADSSEVLDAIDALSTRLRERVGESVGRMQDEPPLRQVTTADLGAFKKFSQASHAIHTEGDAARGVALLEEAVALDSSFASAYAALGTLLSNLGEERGRQVEAFERAYRNRERLSRPRGRTRAVASSPRHSGTRHGPCSSTVAPGGTGGRRSRDSRPPSSGTRCRIWRRSTARTRSSPKRSPRRAIRI
ncbi:MAG: hypothetical protein ACRELC_11085, partial [Gemmatimonadota bacterium]